MSINCDHCHVWADESFLLDDDNTNSTKVDIRNNSTQCNCVTNNTNNVNGTINDNSTNMQVKNEFVYLNDGLLDNMDVPDDSPLLSSSPILTIDPTHCHYNYVQKEDHSSLMKISWAAVLCLLFMVAELVGGYLAGSLAIMTDAAHLFADLISFLLSIAAIKLATKPANRQMTFGYARAEVLGAFLSVSAVWLLAITFFGLAIHRLCTEQYEIDADTMMIVAGLGLGVNIIMGAVLHGVCESKLNVTNVMNSHGHSHAGNTENINVRAALVHVIGDLFQSVGVLVAAVCIKLYPAAKIADPICTILFTFLVIYVTRNVIKDSVVMLMEGSQKNTDDVAELLRSLVGVRNVHSLHVWSLAPGKDALAVHLAVDEYCDRDSVLSEAQTACKEKFSIYNCTIQIETYQEIIMNECDTCQVLYAS